MAPAQASGVDLDGGSASQAVTPPRPTSIPLPPFAVLLHHFDSLVGLAPAHMGRLIAQPAWRAFLPPAVVLPLIAEHGKGGAANCVAR